MSPKALKLIAPFLLIFSSYSAAYEGMQDEQSLDKELATSKNQILESHEAKSSHALAANVRWPTSRPSSGYRDRRFSRFSDQFDFYIWVEQGELWAQIVPVTTGPFVCSSSFSLIQDGIQYDTFKLENISGTSQCGNLYISSVFLVTQWSFYTRKVDLSRDFTLVLNTGSGAERLDVVYATSTTPVPDPDGTKGYVNSNLDIWVPSILFESSRGAIDIYLNLTFYGSGRNGELLWQLEDYGPNP